MKICFFAKVQDQALFNIVEFYKVDITALRALGHEVVCVNTFKDLLRLPCDLYFVWWFGYGFFPVLWARLRGRPCVLTGAVHTPDCGGLAQWPWHKRWLMRLAMTWANRTLFISRTDFAKLGSFCPAHPAVSYCAVDLTVYKPALSEPKQDVIATVTHLTRDNVARKMLLESISAFALFAKQHPSYRYHIGGSFGDAVELVRGHIQACGVEDQVTLLGRISDADKVALLQSARAYLQPSTCEGFGLALLEAQACGTPVVTNREPCIVEINGDHVLYGANVAEWADSLARLADDAALFHEMQRCSLDNAARYSTEVRQHTLRQTLESLGV